MKTITLTENGFDTLKRRLINEASYDDKEELIKNYLNANFMKGTFEKDGRNVGILIQLDHGVPTSKTYWGKDVIEKLKAEYPKIITDERERDEFFEEVLKKWYSQKR